MVLFGLILIQFFLQNLMICFDLEDKKWSFWNDTNFHQKKFFNSKNKYFVCYPQIKNKLFNFWALGFITNAYKSKKIKNYLQNSKF